MFWVVKKSEPQFPTGCSTTLSSDWPTESLMTLTRYHLNHPRKRYLVSEADYNNILTLEKKYEQEADAGWKDFMNHIEKGELTEAISLREENDMFKIVRVLF